MVEAAKEEIANGDADGMVLSNQKFPDMKALTEYGAVARA